MKLVKLFALASAAMALPTAAMAVPTVSQYPGTTLQTFSFSFAAATNTITINEVWNNTNNVFLQISGLEQGVDYNVIKNITNSTGTTWTSIANELLDPGLDPEDPRPQPGFVPIGFSTSSDQDGLSFAQGGGIPRTSTGFPTVVADELSDARDFLDFIGGTGVTNGTSFNVKFGLRDSGTNQPFLLSQRINVRSTGGVPEPTTWAMMIGGFGLVGGSMRVRARRSSVVTA